MSHFFTHEILQWYKLNARNLPWRETTDPYKIWVSEIILQQTRVVQGLSYYHRFIETFPDVSSLAQAKETDVLLLWQGLGYYSRARNMHQAAKQIVQKGCFPSSYEEILQLKGIGTYTASAISSFAFGEPRAVLDGNVFRVLSRYFGIDSPIDNSSARKEFQALAQELLDVNNPSRYNQAIMDFGAIQCLPKGANCLSCPLLESCFAFQQNRVDKLPVKKRVVKIRTRYFNFFYIRNSRDEFYIQQRCKKDIWQHLYQLPLLETEQQMSPAEIAELYPEYLVCLRVKPIEHVLSHQKIIAQCFELSFKDNICIPFSGFWISAEAVKDYGFSQLMLKILNKLLS